jgi:hypothetical protein
MQQVFQNPREGIYEQIVSPFLDPNTFLITLFWNTLQFVSFPQSEISRFKKDIKPANQTTTSRIKKHNTPLQFDISYQAIF